MGPDAFLETLTAKDFAEIDAWQTEMQLKPMRVGSIQLYAPDLGDDHAVTGVERIDDLPAAIAAAIERHGDRDIAVIPEGPYVVADHHGYRHSPSLLGQDWKTPRHPTVNCQ